MRHLIIGVLLASVAAAVSTDLPAQGIGRLLRGTGLVNSDFAIMHEAAAELYTVEQPEVGSETIWQNPETGAHGSVELVAFDGRCATMNHLYRVRGRRDHDRLQSRRCRNDRGEWILNLE